MISSRNFWATTEALTLTPLVGSLTMHAFGSELMVQLLVLVCSNFPESVLVPREAKRGMFDFRIIDGGGRGGAQ